MSSVGAACLLHYAGKDGKNYWILHYFIKSIQKDIVDHNRCQIPLII
jgi:hypothetical protein